MISQVPKSEGPGAPAGFFKGVDMRRLWRKVRKSPAVSDEAFFVREKQENLVCGYKGVFQE